MKSLIYTVILLAVLVACVVLLRSIDGGPTRRETVVRRSPAVESEPPPETEIDVDDYQAASAADLYEAGDELLSLWHVREATKLFERAAREDSSLFDAWVRLVECYSHPLVGREDDALAALRTAREVRASDADTTFLAGIEQLFVVRDYAAAAGLLERARRTEVSDEDATYYLALARVLSGDVEGASRGVQELLRRDATAGRVAELGVRCAVAGGDLATAEERARELARMYAEEPYPYVLLGLVEQLSGRPNSAVEFCDNALVLDSKYIPAILARANLYAAEGRFDAARVSFEKVLMFDDPILRAHGYEGSGFVDVLSGRFNRGVEEMDEAIRSAMLAGAVRQGLKIAVRLVAYLCELGQSDKAAAVVDRWVTGFGEIPVELARVRIEIFKGNLESARESLARIRSSKSWSEWAGMMSVDPAGLVALAHVRAEAFDDAVDALAGATPAAAGRAATRSFLSGYAEFRRGNAEQAARDFELVGQRLYGVEFPYHGDAVQFVRSLYYLGDTRIAVGDEAGAAEHYRRFLDYWGEADWDVQAVARARAKLESLSASATP